MVTSRGAFVQGALLSFFGFTIFCCGDALVKLVGLEAIPPMEQIWLGGLFSSLIICLTILISRSRKWLSVQNPKTILTRVILHIVFIYSYVTTFTNLPLAIGYSAAFLSPFLISILGVLFLKERMSRKQLIAILLGFCGVMIALWSSQDMKAVGIENHTLGYWVLPFYVLLFATNMIYLRIAGKTETSEALTFYPYLTIAIIGLPLLFISPVLTYGWGVYASILGNSVSSVLGFWALGSAYRMAPVAIVAPIQYTQIIAGTLLGYLLWSVVPPLYFWVGTVLIILSGLIVIREAQRQQASAEVPS